MLTTIILSFSGDGILSSEGKHSISTDMYFSGAFFMIFIGFIVSVFNALHLTVFVLINFPSTLIHSIPLKSWSAINLYLKRISASYGIPNFLTKLLISGVSLGLVPVIFKTFTGS